MSGPVVDWSAGPGHECSAAVAAGLLAAGEHWADAVEAAERALARAVCRETALCVSRALATLVCAGELVAADAHSLALVEAGPTGPVAEQALLARACVARRTGDLARCSSLLESLRRGGEEIRPVVLAWTAELLVVRGDPGGARAVLRGREAGHPLLAEAEAVVALASGRPRDALEGFLACGRALAEAGVVNPAVVPWRYRASRAALACGDTENALRLAVEEHTAAARWGEPRTLGLSLAAVAAASPPRGEDLMTWERSVRLLEMAHARTELAEVLCGYGDRLVAHGKQVAAREVFAQARAAAPGAVLVRRAEEALDAVAASLGAEPVLTPVEAEVARLARTGLNTRGIASELALSTRTVELHLTRVYRKLGLSGRRELQVIRWCPASPGNLADPP